MDDALPTLLVRADASATIGTGHVMRCLALAQAWQDAGGSVHWLTAAEAPALEARLRDEGIVVSPLEASPGSRADAEETVRLASLRGARWVVIDGYGFTSAFQKTIRESSLRLLVVDDYGHAETYYADVILNQNLGAPPDWYRARQSGTQLLLGPRYAALRREFLERGSGGNGVADTARRVLLTLGGSDPDNVTLAVLRAICAGNFELQVTVVAGPSNPHLAELEAAAQGAGMRYLTHVRDMPGLMAWADLAIAGAGTTSWELAFMGLPTLTLVLADNQEAVASELERVGFAWNLGRWIAGSDERLTGALDALRRDAPRRQRMRECGRFLVDGLGARRVIEAMEASG